MARIDRRRVLQLSSATAVAAGSGGLVGILASGRAPAYAQGTTLHWLKFVDFVPPSDQLLKGKIAAECEKALGIKLNIEPIDGNSVQARITSAIQSGTGADIIMAINNWPQLYGDSVVDVSDIAEEIGKAQGGYYETARVCANDGKKWIGVPWTIIPSVLVNRTSWFAEIGINAENFPKTWDDYRAAGKKLKPKSRPFGQTLGHTYGDAPAFWYPYLWSWGGKEIGADGKTVVLNSNETVELVKYAIGFWKDCYDEGGFAWDDASNNRAFLSNTCSSTENGASIYLLAKRKFEDYLTETGKPLKDDILSHPAAGGGRRPVQLSRAVHQHGDGLFEEPQGGDGFSALDPYEGGLRPLVRLAGRFLGRRDQDLGEPPAMAERPGHAALPHRGVQRPRSPAMPGRPTGPRPKRYRNTSSSICIPKPCRACRQRMPSNGRMASW